MGLLSSADLAGFSVFGETTRVVHGQRMHVPAAGGRAVRALLRHGYTESDAVLNGILADMGLSAKTISVFMSRREVVRAPVESGGRLEARPIIPGLSDDALSNFSGSDAGYEVSEIFGIKSVVDDAFHKYQLNTLFRDTTLTDKLRLSARRLQSAKRLAVSDPAAAAASLTDYIREHGFPNSVVQAGEYAKTVNNAIDFIRAMGNSIVYADSQAPASVSHTHLEISFDQFHIGEIIWTVRGPLKYATEVNVIYQLAIHYGPEHVIFMLGYETIRLGIDIRNERDGTYYTGALHGYSSLSGISPEGHHFPPELTADQQARLYAAGQMVSPVMVDDAVVGSAVHVTDKHAIINEHTLAMALQNDVVPRLCGSVVEESFSVGGDVCAVRRDGVHAQWLFREPMVGERVVLCYSVGASVEYSEVLQVLGCADQLILSSSNILRRGASGAAVVALRDSALLGIFSTMRASKVICAPFSSSTFAIVSDCQSVASVSQYAGTPGVDAGDRTYAKMVKRGLLGFLEHIERSTTCLYVDAPGGKVVAGLVANVAGEWHTTVDPNAAQLYMQDSRMLSFDTGVSGTYVARAPPPVLQAVPNVRVVEPGERVFVFTKVDDQVIMSSVRIVTHVLTDHLGFCVEDFGESAEEMTGGLIVAERDAAVLGMYAGRDCDSFGKFTVRCALLSRVSETAVSGPDVSVVHTEFVDWVLPIDDTFQAYVNYGRAVWDVAVGSHAYATGNTLAKTLAVGSELWIERHRTVLETLGWPSMDVSTSTRRPPENVAYAALAAVHLRGAQYVMDKLQAAVDGVTASTPIVGEFPFARPPSATGSTVSVKTAVEASDGARIKELEQRMEKLTTLLLERDKVVEN